ncbi:MAG: ABC transporter permease [Saprospiraceae bacterium]|nr:ABC transporter permease [Saprospiraceae bacterium]
MNPEHFIAKRIAFSKSNSFTRIIIRIAIVAIAISLSVMILTTAVIDGFKKEITEKIFGFWGHIHITDSNVNRNFELIPVSSDEEYINTIRDIQEIDYQEEASILGYKLEGNYKSKSTYGGVKGAHPFIVLPALMSTKNNDMHGLLLKGVDSGYDWDRMKEFIVEGDVIGYNKDTLSSDLLISRNIARKLGVKVGEKVVMHFIRDNNQIKKRFQICGIYNTGLEEYDRKLALVDLAKLQDVLGWKTTDVQGIEVILDDIKDLDIYADYIYYDVVPPRLYAESIRSKFPGIFEWLQLQDINETIILQLMILVAIINMITVLLILILERTHMIGVLKSLGANNWFIRKIFLYNAGYIIFFGLLAGNFLGIGIALAQKHFKYIKLDEANYYLDTAPIEISWMTILLLNLAAFVVTVVFMVFPTWLVSRITPVKALRFD